ncbi:N-acetyltransferase [Microbacterium barkeri]|uniref:N-acetyltransferase n=1 Tax=Microbacterium barkeri TaxID=33917 RepID=A0A9W6LWW5_9MICO|nr:GNAT family N-acetyltransferase [Microbacterium barkeri]MDR6876948.1 putative acetyltransferase [Microbacterium barkeri]GLJ61872.1 N-acetyltransferase [Microbacterium barkeri]
MTIDIRVDDLTHPATQALAAIHLAGMHAGTPAESVHALDLDGLRHPSVTLWSAWIDDQIAGIGALKRLDDERGELKSFRTAETHLGRGVARAVLRHIIAEARTRGMASLWLETGSDAAFAPARGLYASEGFVECGPFDDYVLDPLSAFMTRTL